MSAQQLRSPRLLKKRRRRIVWRSALSALGIFILILLPTLLAHASFVRIHTVSVTNNAAVPESEIKEFVGEHLTGSYVWLFPRSNIFLYPRTKIENDLLAKFSRLETARIKMKSLTEISVSVEERKPSALWCDSEDQKANCYFLDSSGFVFDVAPSFTENVFITYRGNITEDPIGKTFVKKEEFENLAAFVSAIKALSLSPVAVSSFSENDYTLTLSGGEQILFTTRESVEQSISNLTSVLADPKLALRSGVDLSVQSIDLRFGNKVFYKQKGN